MELLQQVSNILQHQIHAVIGRFGTFKDDRTTSQRGKRGPYEVNVKDQDQKCLENSLSRPQGKMNHSLT